MQAFTEYTVNPLVLLSAIFQTRVMILKIWLVCSYAGS